MKRYEKYKDSGVEWIGKIPEHWEFPAIKHISRVGYGESLKSEVRIDGEYEVWGSNGIVGKHTDAITKGATVIIGRKGSFGKTNFCETSCYPIDTTFYIDETQTINNLRWLYYSLSTQRLDAFSKDSSIPGINREEIYEKHMPLPTPLEQVQIAKFLDYKTSLIDELIAKKQRKIELLKEQRTAIINRAVTKGLNPNVKMKPSGVDWIGMIPEGWDLKKLKFLIFHSTEKAQGDIFFKVALENIESGTGCYIEQESEGFDGESKSFQIGDVLFNKLRPYLAKVLLADKPGACVGELLVIRPLGEIIPDFLLNRLLSRDFIEIINSSTYGSKMPRASIDFFLDQYIPLPPIVEQNKIVNYISHSVKLITDMVTSENRKIELLEEYRLSLISEVVTGKIDVRDFVPPTN